MIRFKIYFDKDKETQWLNKMAEKGWAMKHFFIGFFTFEKCQPNEYIYQIDFVNSFGHVTEDYQSFMEESDIEIVQSWGYWTILRKQSVKGSFDLYTDLDSQIEHYKKIIKMFKIVSILEIICLFFEMLATIISQSLICFGAFLIILVCTIVLLLAVFNTADRIHTLKQQKTGITEASHKRISFFLIIGLLTNSVAIVLPDMIPHFFSFVIHSLAIILILVGCVRTLQQRKQIF